MLGVIYTRYDDRAGHSSYLINTLKYIAEYQNNDIVVESKIKSHLCETNKEVMNSSLI